MPNCDFYALAGDCVEVLDFIFAQPGWTLHEMYSVPDNAVRVFYSTESIRDTFLLGEESIYFQLYAPAMGGSIKHRRITLNPGAIPGASFRYDTQGWGLIQLYLHPVRDGELRASHTNHNTETRAQRWSSVYPEMQAVEEWDWAGVARVSGKLVRHIRKLGVDKHGTRPVLKEAFEAMRDNKLRLVH